MNLDNNCTESKKPDKNEYKLYDFNYRRLQKMQTIAVESIYWGRLRKEDYKGIGGNLGVDEYVHYLDLMMIIWL